MVVTNPRPRPLFSSMIASLLLLTFIAAAVNKQNRQWDNKSFCHRVRTTMCEDCTYYNNFNKGEITVLTLFPPRISSLLLRLHVGPSLVQFVFVGKVLVFDSLLLREGSGPQLVQFCQLGFSSFYSLSYN